MGGLVDEKFLQSMKAQVQSGQTAVVPMPGPIYAPFLSGTRIVPTPMGEKGAAIADPKLKASNPKSIIGSDKMPFHLWPETATILGVLGLLDGALKYGRTNFRVAGVKASTYYDAIRRHLNKWMEGEDTDPDSGLPHFAHILASVAILVDAQAAGVLNDDRMVQGGYVEMLNELTPHVARLKALHADKNPKHYTIADNAA